ncbi:hypothetical protein [Agarilytica rhodophyticola]|uniref:hypothetical protein n=1 Tax=Agarilytica rhodophyticola TaxID=1737490 RepID=UPI000B34A0A3|nr:hypothetical protein [Agarilytica rhodophyticola]
MNCNLDDYRGDIAEFNLTKEEEDELLLTLWEMMRMFVQIEHGIDSTNMFSPDLLENSDQS